MAMIGNNNGDESSFHGAEAADQLRDKVVQKHDVPDIQNKKAAIELSKKDVTVKAKDFYQKVF